MARVNIDKRADWPELRKGAIFEAGGEAILGEIRKAPPAIQKAITADMAALKLREFLTPFNAWGAMLEILQRHHPALAAEATPLVAELAGYECERS